MQARIFQPAKGATQSGFARTRHWHLVFEGAAPRQVEPLMGWTASTDMDQQVRLAFATREAAVAYAQKHGIPFRVDEPHARKVQPKAYADNFRYDRVAARGAGPALPGTAAAASAKSAKAAETKPAAKKPAVKAAPKKLAAKKTASKKAASATPKTAAKKTAKKRTTGGSGTKPAGKRRPAKK